MTNQAKSPKYSPEVRERAVRMVLEHRSEHTSQWAAIASIAAKIGCTSQTLSTWVKPRQARRPEREREAVRQWIDSSASALSARFRGVPEIRGLDGQI